MIQWDCNIIVVLCVQLRVYYKNFFHLLFLWWRWWLKIMRFNKTPIMYSILAWNVQTRIDLWGSAPHPTGAYYAPQDPLVMRGFLPTAITAARLTRSGRHGRRLGGSPPKFEVGDGPCIVPQYLGNTLYTLKITVVMLQTLTIWVGASEGFCDCVSGQVRSKQWND